MYRGVLITESIRVGATLEGIPLVIGSVSRFAPRNTTPDQPSVPTGSDPLSGSPTFALSGRRASIASPAVR